MIVKLWELKTGQTFAGDGLAKGGNARTADPAVAQIATRLGYNTDSIQAFMRRQTAI